MILFVAQELLNGLPKLGRSESCMTVSVPNVYGMVGTMHMCVCNNLALCNGNGQIMTTTTGELLLYWPYALKL